MNSLLSVCLLLAAAPAPSAEYPEFNFGETAKGADYVQAIKVLAPRCGSNVKGDVTVVFEAKGMTRVLARCWKGGGKWGEDAVLADLAPDAHARGSFVFPADGFPSGPVAIRLQALGEKGLKDYFELQLYNLGGTKWKQGIPSSDPPGAKGLALVFQDDFDRPLSISSDGRGARYAAHKTGGGDFSGWPFSDPEGDMLPFSRQDTYLRIHASKPFGTKGRTGILSSLRADGTGIAVPVPSYFECRLMCHSAPGSWGAFWTLTKGTIGLRADDPRRAAVEAAGCDELDVIECYGGYGPGHPNHGGKFGVTTHWWNQPGRGQAPHAFPDACALAGGSSWSWTFHTYGVAITETDTVYYFDDVEVLRHPTGPVAKTQESWFLVNYAISGISGWPYDLERYGNESDMWVDWVRVYCGKPLPPGFGKIPVVGVKGAIGVNFLRERRGEGFLRPGDIAGDGARAQRNWNNLPLAEALRGATGLRDGQGRPTTLAVALTGEAQFEACEGWGFDRADFRLHREAVRKGSARVSGVPFARYDLVVHLGAGVNGWRGDVVLDDGATGRELARKPVDFAWNEGGRYADGRSMAVFRNLDARACSIRLVPREGKGAPALAGFQILPTQDAQ